MDLSKARAIYDNINTRNYGFDDKMNAVFRVLTEEKPYKIMRRDLIRVLKWLIYEMFILGEDGNLRRKERNEM